jgi:hypothetical protein
MPMFRVQVTEYVIAVYKAIETGPDTVAIRYEYATRRSLEEV